FLDRLAPEQFTFAWWYDEGKGCAIGLAAAYDPWFQAQGLRLANPESLKACAPVSGQASDWQAVARCFGLSREQALRLFSADGYAGRPAPAAVAAAIRRFLAEPAFAPAFGGHAERAVAAMAVA